MQMCNNFSYENCAVHALRMQNALQYVRTTIRCCGNFYSMQFFVFDECLRRGKKYIAVLSRYRALKFDGCDLIRSVLDENSYILKKSFKKIYKLVSFV